MLHARRVRLHYVQHVAGTMPVAGFAFGHAIRAVSRTPAKHCLHLVAGIVRVVCRRVLR